MINRFRLTASPRVPATGTSMAYTQKKAELIKPNCVSVSRSSRLISGSTENKTCRSAWFRK